MGNPLKYQFPFAKYPAVRIALLFAGGIVLAVYTEIGWKYWAATLAAVLLTGILSDLMNRKRAKVWPVHIATAAYLLGLLLFGAIHYSVFNQGSQASSTRLLSVFAWEQVTFKGTVQQADPSSTGSMMYDIVIEKTILRDSLTWNETFKIRAYGDNQQEIKVSPGDNITFKATLYPLEQISNPGEFKYKRYLASQNIFIHAGIDTVYAVESNEKWFSWNGLQQHVLQLIEQNFSRETEALAKSLLIGYKSELDQDTKTAFSRVGLVHIMAVSGMNVVYILAPFWLLIPFLWTFRFGKQAGFALMICILFIFAGLTGFSASVMRACIMGGFITYGRIFNKARNSKNLTAVAAIIILLINPNALFSVGFQLSFAAVYIILLVLPVVQRLIPGSIQHRWYGMPVMAAVVTFVVQTGLYPILSFYFHEFSLIAPLANAVVVPFLGLMVPYALLLLFVAAVFPSLGFVLNAPCRLFLEFLQWFTSTLSQWGWSWLQTPDTDAIIFLIWLAAFLLIASIRIPKLRWKILIAFLSLLAVQQITFISRAFQLPKMQVTILDVGQGDAALVTTASNQHFLIDTGRWSPGYNSGSEVILPFLKASGIKKLEGVFLSHPHADHIGGMAALIGNIPIEVIYSSGVSYSSDLYRHYLNEASHFNISVKELQAGDIVQLGTATKVFVYGPTPRNHFSDVNEHSLIFEIIYGKTEFLFMGDAGKRQEEMLVQHYKRLLNTDFLKVGHHGSNTSSSALFLKAATPAISVVSVAKNNRYGLPDAKAVRRLKKNGTKLYFTALSEALQFVSNGKTIKRIMWR